MLNQCLTPTTRLSEVSFSFEGNLLSDAGGAAASGGGGAASEGFSKMKESMGMLGGRPMTRDEAFKILNINQEEGTENDEVDHEMIMERFDTLLEKNQIDKGGSFYI